MVYAGTTFGGVPVQAPATATTIGSTTGYYSYTSGWNGNPAFAPANTCPGTSVATWTGTAQYSSTNPPVEPTTLGEAGLMQALQYGPVVVRARAFLSPRTRFGCRCCPLPLRLCSSLRPVS